MGNKNKSHGTTKGENEMKQRKLYNKSIEEESFAIVKARAFSFSRSGVPQDELESEGLVVYAICLLKYKQNSKTKFTTFLYGCLNNHFSRYVDTYRKQLPAMFWFEDQLPDVPYYENTERQLIFKQEITKLSPEAQGIISILEECADEIIILNSSSIKEPHAQRNLIGTLKKFLTMLGWQKKTIEKTFNELTEYCHSF